MRERKISVFLYLFWLSCNTVAAQNYAVISGIVADTAGVSIPEVNIIVENTGKGAVTDSTGYYRLILPLGQGYTLVLSHVGYAVQRYTLNLQDRESGGYEVRFTLHDQPQSLSEVSVTADRAPQGTLQRIATKDFRQLPNPSGSFEALLKTMPGVSSNNELSSQYSVRGGSFDENLVYVNDIEIHRPMLVRSGQQEGLSFINPDLVESVDFSAGGFDACFGDKMSSVLDVRYRTPEKFAGSASLSLLTSASVEGLAAGRRLSYLAGVRYKTSQYLLGTLDTKGQYNPDFFDIQSLLTYRLAEKWNLELLSNVARNRYRFIPETRDTNFGTLYNAYNLRIYYNGQEVDRYTNGTGALTLGYRPTDRLTLKLTGLAYLSHEQETFDIEGAYSLNELDASQGSSTHGGNTANIGVGSKLSHARNYLDARIWSVSHTGTYRSNNGSWRWSMAWQRETADDRMNEWVMLDSAGYSVPYNSKSIELEYARSADNYLAASRFISSLQYMRRLTGERMSWTITAGLRLNYNDVNRERLLSPRASVTIRPLAIPQLSGHIAAGLYGQPPAYRELRDMQGRMNTAMKAQRSVHYVAGADYTFRVGQLPFKLSTELYYKRLNRLAPYRMENVRIYHAGDNMAKGYIVGWDIKLNGEFVEGAESWISLSLMHARADIKGDAYGGFPLPTDQTANFNLFFQDYIPGAPSWRACLNMSFSTPLPYSYPVPDRYDLTFRMPAYRRVDLGFSKEFFKEERPHKFFRQIWLNVEIFNLFDTNNTISYLWIQVVSNRDGMKQQYAVPNYLTARHINIKLSATF
ncbi:MAG: TonB-dependent receptor [Bacteroidales bacterium]|jgi:hypothetical protein|nr:TonB-dependent receptor [Bacteroidales bacterium]